MDAEIIKEANIDYETGKLRFCGKTELYDKFLLKLYEDKCCSDAKSALERGDEEALYRAIHTLKGIAGNLSIITLYNLCIKFCSNFKSGDKENLPEQCEAIFTEFTRVCQILSKNTNNGNV